MFQQIYFLCINIIKLTLIHRVVDYKHSTNKLLVGEITNHKATVCDVLGSAKKSTAWWIRRNCLKNLDLAHVNDCIFICRLLRSMRGTVTGTWKTAIGWKSSTESPELIVLWLECIQVFGKLGQRSVDFGNLRLDSQSCALSVCHS